MLKRIKISRPDDYFTELGQRSDRGVYFYRINAYNEQIRDFIRRYYETARLNGVIIEGKLANPDNNALSYYNEIMGMSFQMDRAFFGKSLRKWLPRMSDSQRENVADSIYNTLSGLRLAGKNDNMLKNAYIKFMCWLYYKFERIVHRLGEEKLPKILYEGNIGNYELLLMNVLAIAGCDIALLQYRGDSEYLKIDADSSISYEMKLPGMTAFPPEFSLRQIRQDIQDAYNRERLYGTKPDVENCTNAWMTGNFMEDIRQDTGIRGSDDRFFYNCFCRIMGVEDKLTYLNELYQLQLELKNRGRRVVIVNGRIDPPSPDEIGGIRRNNYKNADQMIMDLAVNIKSGVNQELQLIMNKVFVDLMLEESGKDGGNVNRLTNKAVYILCWMKRYHQMLFGNWKMPEIGCFFYMGGCRNENEALFCRFLSRLPVDVVIFNPNLNQKCCLTDRLLYEIHYDQSLPVSVFPEENTGIRVGTAAYHAERELDSMMYQDTGIYRSQQYGKASAVFLQTMYEEIPILWDQELRYRPNFSTVDNVVNIPVISSIVSGVKNGELQAYWSSIKNLITPDTVVIKRVPCIEPNAPNPMKVFATEFFRNGRLQKSRIRNHKAYQYGFLREAMQEHLLDKLELLIDQKFIKGTFENGTEYTIVSVALNLDKNILRMIQRFDFTRKSPKLIYIITGETLLSLEDAIYAVYLNQVGFDVLFFVPTGYQCIGQHLNRHYIEEHQIGEYIYDLEVPDFDTIPSNINTRPSWRDIFKRGI